MSEHLSIVQLGGSNSPHPVGQYLPAINALLSDEAAYGRDLTTGQPVEEESQWLERRAAMGVCLAALALTGGEPQLIGFAALDVPASAGRLQRLYDGLRHRETPRSAISQLVVDPAWRNQGIGSQLLLQLAIKADHAQLPLPSVTLNRGSRAINWYRRLAINQELRANPRVNVVQLTTNNWNSIIINYSSEKARRTK